MRLIDADELDYREIDTPSPEMWDWINEHIGDWLDGQPTIDAVPVVRCKDCRDREVCITSDDWYCADAERSRR